MSDIFFLHWQVYLKEVDLFNLVRCHMKSCIRPSKLFIRFHLWILKNAEYDLIQFWHGQTDLKFINFCPFCPKQFLWNCHLVKFLCFDQLISNSAESHLQSGKRLKIFHKRIFHLWRICFPTGERSAWFSQEMLTFLH